MYEHAYRYQIIHKPDQDLIHVKVWEEGNLLLDTGDLIDSSNATLKGGRLGVFCMSQEDITWSALSYRLVINCGQRLLNILHINSSLDVDKEERK